MSRRRRSALLVAVLAAVAVAVVAVVVVRGRSEAPALDAQSAPDEFRMRFEGGETSAYGLVYMYNRSKKPIELERARVIAHGSNVPKDFRFLVAGPNRTDDLQGGSDTKCPPRFFKPASMKPLSGFVLQPDTTADGEQGAVLIICFTAPPASSRFHMTETSITYRQDGEEHTTTFPNVVNACSAPKAKCDPDADVGNGT